MQKTVITPQESQLAEMFQVEELEQRLENKWDVSSLHQDPCYLPNSLVYTC